MKRADVVKCRWCHRIEAVDMMECLSKNNWPTCCKGDTMRLVLPGARPSRVDRSSFDDFREAL